MVNLQSALVAARHWLQATTATRTCARSGPMKLPSASVTGQVSVPVRHETPADWVHQTGRADSLPVVPILHFASVNCDLCRQQ